SSHLCSLRRHDNVSNESGRTGGCEKHRLEKKINSLCAVELEKKKIGKNISSFRIVSEIGEGGMGVVFLAEPFEVPKRFAIKSLSKSLSSDPQFRNRFYGEAQKQAILDHPNIVQVTDFFEADGQFFLVMEFVDGQDLGKLIRAKGKLPEHEALPIFQ